jgi:cyclic beta-1,2-glucan synthetase
VTSGKVLLPGGRNSAKAGPWNDPSPIRAELFGTERLEHHALSLAAAQRLRVQGPAGVPSLAGRVRDNENALLEAYRFSAQALQRGQQITPAAEWLLDNFHIVEQQLRQVEDDLPPGFYRQLPKLADGPFAGYPRVLGLAWAYVAHTDSLVSEAVLVGFVQAYQSVQPLTIGELWAVAITLRIVLIENMRRLSDQIVSGHREREAADDLVDRVLARTKAPGASPHAVLAEYDAVDLSEIMAAQICKRLRGIDPSETPLPGWLEDRLRRQNSSVDAVVASAQFRQGASSVTMRNIVNSMRRLSEIDWAELFEELSLVDAKLRESSGFAAMDFATRNSYRTVIEDIARRSDKSELQVAEAALSRAAGGDTDKTRDPGHWLIGSGSRALERDVKFAPPLRLRVRRVVAQLGLTGYLGAIGLVTLGLLALAAWFSGAYHVALMLTGLGVAAEAGTAVVNLAVTRAVGPKNLPALELETGIPPEFRTLVAVPVLLANSEDLQAQIEGLEVHYLSSITGAVHYALLSDGPDCETQTQPQDEPLIAQARAGIAALNARYPSTDGDRFHLLHRRRMWNASESVWMGWERKRGKLTELNHLLRGATDTSFLPGPAVPQGIRFVITLDADTRLLRDTVRRLIGKMAHPLNRAVLDPDLQRVTDGYGILQPNVSPALPVGREGSLYQRIFSSPGGIEPYAAANSDVYQDLFAEGTFTGKGIYDVDAFEAALAGRVPDNTLLSHDLFEGTFARAGLVSDIQVVEDFPSRHDVDAKRIHRWVRGDWQLLPWITGRRATRGGIPAIGRWKMLDNLRRSLTAPLALLSLFAGWLLPLHFAIGWTVAVLVLLALPRLIALPFDIMPGRAGITARSHLNALLADAGTALAQVALSLVLLADTAEQMLDAILRTLSRLRRREHLLEWLTAALSRGSGLPSYPEIYVRRWPGIALALGLCAIAVAINPAAWALILPFALLWTAAPAIARRISLPRDPRPAPPLSATEARELRLIARRTWRYFETFVTEANHFLPPDNFQETPRPVVAQRTSPTNIGLYLLSITAANDMGWISQAEAVMRLEQTLTTMQNMPRYRGHLHNWHDAQTLQVMEPAYVSSVDSGNLAGHLIAVAQACEEWLTGFTANPQGVDDALALAAEALQASPDPKLSSLLADLAKRPDTIAEAARQAEALTGADSDLTFWLRAAATSHAGQTAALASPERLRAAGDLARQFAMEMQFGFLLQPDKKLLSIGFSVSTNMLDTNCYDLLASESQLASLFAIAKGDVPTRHWFRLGRAATPVGAGSALISWSGSMFEYLMPMLVMHMPAGSVLEETNHRVVERQESYGSALGIPWGISESSYNARDLEMTYQYSNFGVPGLGLKRGLSENRVIAPYATGLASMIDPQRAARNYAALETLGAKGRYGFYEAVDFTPARVPEGETSVLVRSFMAHHQGMTITAIANALQDGRLRRRFHAEPIIKAVDLLLQEHVPRDTTFASPRAEEVLIAAADDNAAQVVRHFASPGESGRTAHLLSNGNYSVMLTPTGAGESRWRDMAVTRWRPDATNAALGSFIYLRDTRGGALWSAGVQPTGKDADLHQAVFSEHHARFTHQGRDLTAETEVVVSAEDDAEARRVTLTNTGRLPREIELTSYAELVLAPPASDLSHPAFSKMFVVTDYLPELGVLIATRRKRSPDDPSVWAAHLVVVEGNESAPGEYETDRARFVGRGHGLADAVPSTAALSGTTGTVLDPIFSLRRRVLVPGGGRARVTFWTMVAATPEDLLILVERHRDASAFGRAATLSWTQSQVQLRHLGITSAAAADFQRLGGMLIRGDARLRAGPAQILAGAGPQSRLWALGISGDLPIVLFLISDAEDVGRLHEVLTAQEYWRMRQMAVDLVILNDRSTSYVQDLQIAIEAAARSSHTQADNAGVRGAIYTLRADLTPSDARAHLLAAAAVVLVASRGSIGQQLDSLPPLAALAPIPALPRPTSPTPIETPQLEFFNGLGGFAQDGREYVTVFRGGRTTPAPWINVISNGTFGFQVSAEGSGFTWAENSRENQLTPWSNDPVSDPVGEALYLRDLESGQVWTPTALPIRTQGTYTARHGFGYSCFHHACDGIAAEMVQFVPLDASVKITRLTLHNTSGRTRKLSVTAYAEWILGTSRSATAASLITEVDQATGAILVCNPRAIAFPGRVAFADLGEATSSRSGDRAEFLGSSGSLANPAGVSGKLSGRVGPSLDPCASLQRTISLEPGETAEVVFLLGQATSTEAARDLILATRARDTAKMLEEVKAYWSTLLTSVQIKTPDRAMDVMLNGWLMYQTLACRLWARSGFYQASGAYGFRDQLQDGMALTALRPEMTREHLLRAAGRQFPEGDVQHWWLPHSGQGVRTRISDDRVWLSFAVAQYIRVSGDMAVLDEVLPFLDGPALRPGVHDDFFQPGPSDLKASLFEHCALGLDQALTLTGTNGMPLIGTGDWNDGMNRVGEGGQGTSVWLGWLLIATIGMMAPLADTRDPARAKRWRDHAEAVRQAIEKDGWDGAWYRRGTFDDGTLLGSASSEECQIDSIAQSWAVISGAGDPARARIAMGSLTDKLIRPGLALLFTPPFDRTPLDPGYIKGYPPGLRENGGQYTHAAMWAILAQVGLGDGDAAHGLFALLNPIHHADSPEAAARYKVEPYVIAADVYSAAPHEGRGGWTWYTGSAGWMYRAGIEGLIGLTRVGQDLRFDPCFAKDWPQVEIVLNLGAQPCTVTILNPAETGRYVRSAKLNGANLPCTGGVLVLPIARLGGQLTIELGPQAPSADRISTGVFEAEPTGR